MASETPSVPAPVACRRWIQSKGDNCFAAADYIVWGRLFKSDHLGPRCRDCFIAEHPEMALDRLGGCAIYLLPTQDLDTDLQVARDELVERETEIMSLRGRLRMLADAIEFEVGCMEHYGETKAGALAQLAREMAEPIRSALDALSQDSESSPPNSSGSSKEGQEPKCEEATDA